MSEPSATPRTDAEVWTFQPTPDPNCEPACVVDADFARQLETELAQAQEEIADLKKGYELLFKENGKLKDGLADMTALAKTLAGSLDASHPLSVAWSAQYGYTHNKGNVHETHQLIIDKINAALTLAREKGVL